MEQPLQMISFREEIVELVAADRLSGLDNWRTWRSKIWDALFLRGIQGHLDGTNIRPSPIVTVPAVGKIDAVLTNDAAGIAWDRDDYVAAVNMRWNIADVDCLGIQDGHSAADIWRVLHDRYARMDIISQQMLIDRLRSKIYEDGTSISEHLDEMERRKTAANQSGAIITDEQYKMMIIQSFPPSLNALSMPMYFLDTSYDVKLRLRTYERHLQYQALSSTSTAHISQLEAPQANCTKHVFPEKVRNNAAPRHSSPGHTVGLCYTNGGGF